MDYDILASRTGFDALVQEVKARIKNGWEPQGGVSVMSDDMGTLWVQAMVKKPKGVRS